MAKDGTVRGGKRAGSGRKRNDLKSKVQEGRSAEIIRFAEFPDVADIKGEDMPKVADWLKEEQHDGEEWEAENLVISTTKWLKERGCDQLVMTDQIYEYAVATARWIQCQRAISRYGFLSKHPTTKEPMESPYVKMSEKFFKQSNAAWYAIFQIVKENSMEAYEGYNPHENIMANLLSN